MKRIRDLSLLLLLALYSLPVFAQEGVVTYEETLKMEIDLPPEMQHMAGDIPDTQTATRLLYFNESASLLKSAPREEPSGGGHFYSDDGAVIRVERSGDDNVTFTNMDEGQRIERREFLGRTFLVTGDIEPLAWKLTDERSEFLGYMCQKATAQRDSVSYEAWFTPEIAVSAGPGRGGLPGLILVLNINDGQRTLVARELSLESLEKGAIEPPKKGKKVSQEEFDEIVEEKLKEMNVTRRGGNNVIIRMQN